MRSVRAKAALVAVLAMAGTASAAKFEDVARNAESRTVSLPG